MEKEGSIDLKLVADNRNEAYAAYEKNYRMRTFGGSWTNRNLHGGENTWAHLGIFCRQQFDEPDDGNWTSHEKRLVFLGLIVGYVNSDKCDWEPEDRKEALETAWDYIRRNRPSIQE